MLTEIFVLLVLRKKVGPVEEKLPIPPKIAFHSERRAANKNELMLAANFVRVLPEISFLTAQEGSCQLYSYTRSITPYYQIMIYQVEYLENSQAKPIILSSVGKFRCIANHERYRSV